MISDFKKMELDKFCKVSVSNNQLRSSYGGGEYSGNSVLTMDYQWDCGWTQYAVEYGNQQNGMDK